jgi:hypothetical protein
VLVLIAGGALLLGSFRTGSGSVAGWLVLGAVLVAVMPRIMSNTLAEQDGRAHRQMAQGWGSLGLEGPGSETFELAYLQELRHPTCRNQQVSELIVRWAADGRQDEIGEVLDRATWDFRRCVGSCLDGSVSRSDGLPRFTDLELFRVRHGRWTPAQSTRAQLALSTAAAVLGAQGRSGAAEELMSRLCSAAMDGRRPVRPDEG